MALGTTNIGTVEVGTAIGLYVHDFGLLCADLEVETVAGVTSAVVPHARKNRINKWSKWKPIVHATIPITEPILKANYYGLTIPDLSCGALKTYALGTLDIADDTTQIKWDYTPWNVLFPARIDDYRNYQKDSQPLFNVSEVHSGAGIAWDGYGLLKWQINLEPSQATGGLVPSDFTAAEEWRLGVMLIDYEHEGNPIVLIKANDASIATSRSITIDITDLVAATYIVSLFIYSDGLGGFAQINDPSAGQLTAIGNVYPIENGMPAIGLPGFYEFVLWAYIGTGMLPTGYDDSDYYTLFHNINYDPAFLTDPSRMNWDDFSNYFSIEKIVTFEPARRLKWSLDFAMYLHTSAYWADDSWRGLVSWPDMDSFTVYLIMKTIITGGMKKIHLAFYDLGTEEIIGSAYVSTTTLSESTTTPTVIRLSNYNGDTQIMTVSINGVVTALTSTAVNTTENPPIFHFGNDGTDTVVAPKGLAYNYIDIRAYGQDSA